MGLTNSILKPVADLVVARSVRQQKGSRLRDPSLWGARVDERGHLGIDGVALAEVVSRFGSPALVVGRSTLLADAMRVRDACATAGYPVRPYYSYKTNCIPGILREIHALGLGAEVISPYELWLAERLGVPGDAIIYNGVNKSADSLKRAVEIGVFSLNVDHLGEVDLVRALAEKAGRRLRVGVRLRLLPESHFGLSLTDGEAMAAVERILGAPRWLELQSVHFHLVAAARNSALHRRLTLAALEFIAQVRDRHGVRVPCLDVGGGFGVPTSGVMSRGAYAMQRLFTVPGRPPDPADHVSFEDYLRDLVATVRAFVARRGIEAPTMIIEPGRVITSRAEILVSRVHTIKRNRSEPHFALTDAGRVLIAYPCDYEYHQIFVANRMRAPLQERYNLMGRLCTTADWLARNRLLPSLSEGDTIAVMDAGAYFSSYASNFAFPRPAIVMAEGGRTEVLRSEESFEHLCAMDHLEDRESSRR